MKTLLPLLTISTALLFGCATTVHHGPANPPPPGSSCNNTTVYVDEPQPAPITQKSIPANESSLKKTGPDETLTK